MGDYQGSLHFLLGDQRRISVLIFGLFFSWLLAVPFEGQVLYALAHLHNIDPHKMIFGAIIAHLLGLLSSGLFVKSMIVAKRLIRYSVVACIVGNGVFLFPPSILWDLALILTSYLAGTCVAAWGYFFKNGTPPNQRFKTVADGLILSNLLMIILNMTAIYISVAIGLWLSMALLGCAAWISAYLPVDNPAASSSQGKDDKEKTSVVKPLLILCLFIVILTINSGLMYQVINPAFAHLDWLVSWYWAVPYILALYVMRNVSHKVDRSYILYVAIALIGFSFIGFMVVDRSAISYLLVDTLLLGACGVYDLFWWSILAEMLDLHDNPATILGAGLSANVFGVLAGGFIGNIITSGGIPSHITSIMGLTTVCIAFVILPPLHRHLSTVLKNHAYLTAFTDVTTVEQGNTVNDLTILGHLTEREKEIAVLLFKGRTYKIIAQELFLSENTVKTHVKNIYSKLHIRSRMELINLMVEGKSSGL